MSRSQRGFTLLEILVALSVLGLIVGELYGGLRLTLRAAETQSTITGKTGEYDAVDRTLRRLIAEADPGGPGLVPLYGTVGTIAFFSTLPDAHGAQAAEIGIGLTNGSLLLRWTPRLAGQPLSPVPARKETELVRGVQSVQLSYWSGATWKAEWAEPQLPTLLRLRISFPSGDTRHWPELVLATERQRPS